MTQMFRVASECGVKTIALPAVGTGGFGYAPIVVVREICQAIEEYFTADNPTSITDVSVVLAEGRPETKLIEPVSASCMRIPENTCYWKRFVLNVSPLDTLCKRESARIGYGHFWY